MIQGYTLATFPNAMQYIYAQPEKQAKELCNGNRRGLNYRKRYCGIHSLCRGKWTTSA